MRPIRLAGRSRKLSDLYTDAKVPRRLRALARVVIREADGEVMWADYLGPAVGAGEDLALTDPEAAATNKD